MNIVEGRYVNPCRMYVRVGGDLKMLNGFKKEQKEIRLFMGSSCAGYREESYPYDEIEITERRVNDVNPNRLYARVSGKSLEKITGFKAEYDSILLFKDTPNSEEQRFLLEEVEIIEK